MNNSNTKTQLEHIFSQIMRFRVLLFMVVLLLVYGFMVWRVNVLSTAEPDASAVASKTQSLNTPKVDQATIDKIKQLQDNSVNVQALFDQARNNPFHE